MAKDTTMSPAVSTDKVSSGKKRKSSKTSARSASSPVPSTSTSSPAKKRKVEQEDGEVAAVVVGGDGEAAVEEQDAEELEDEDGVDAEEDSGESMSKAAKGKAKKKRKEELRALENPPTFSFDTRGFKGGRMIQTKDVRDFVLHLLSDEKAQQWLYVANKRNVRRVVALMLPGVTPSTLGIASPSLAANLPFSLLHNDPSFPESQLPIFQKLFSHACPTKAPGERGRMHSCWQAFTNCPLTGGEKTRREKSRKEKGQTEKSSDPAVYLLSRERMIEQAYPALTPHDSTPIISPNFADWKRADGWIEAPYMKEGYGTRKVLGIDCEMCLTEDGSELTRVSVVDAKGHRMYDSLVKPDKPILDYLTRYSGLTAEALENVTTRLEDIQAKLAELIDYNTILLGHSLECDLRVLKLIHPFVIDTSEIYQHPRGPPFKASLKWLAQKWLKKEIQNSVPGVASAGGHDSEEDARTCVELLNLKMEKGPGFGEFVNDQETIFERIARGPEPKSSAVCDHGTPAQWHGAKAKSAVGCSNDDEVLQGMLDSIEEHDLTIGRFMELSHALNWSQPTNAVAGKSSSNPPVSEPMGPAELASLHATINSRLTNLHNALPPLTALVIFTGHSDPQAMSKLSAKKANFDRLYKTIKQSKIANEDRWLEEDDRQLADEVERCRSGLSFYCVKA